jgi:hypothetical protein
MGSSGGSIPPLPGTKCTAASPCTDFPPSPIIDPLGSAVGPDPASLFGGTGGGPIPAGSPCVVEPADGSLYPKNWLRPRVAWMPGAGQVFEVRFHSAAERNDLVVYTSNTQWAMDAATWQAIAWTPGPGGVGQDGSLVGQSITVTVRGDVATAAGTATFQIAPAVAGGSIVYWTAAGLDENATNTTLAGFRPGDEGTTPLLSSEQVVQQVRAQPVDGGSLSGSFQQVYCIGCHTTTPDGNFVAFTAQWPWPNTLASIQTGSTGQVPVWLSRGAVQNLSPDYRGDPFDSWYEPAAVDQVSLGIGTFSPQHYATGDRKLVTTLGASWTSDSPGSLGVASGVTSQLAWFDLEWDDLTTLQGGLLDAGLPVATPCVQQANYPGILGSSMPCLPASQSDGGWNIIARMGDPNGAGAPSWSHGVAPGLDAIAYASTNAGVKDGRMDCSASPTCFSDIYVVPYAGGFGGAARALPGASSSDYNEYYPDWSPDDTMVAYNRVPTGFGMYNQPKAEVYVTPYSQGMGGPSIAVTSPFPPPACSNPPVDGVQDSWPKWAPNGPGPQGTPTTQVDANGNQYYWLTFSSIRSPWSNGKAQIYVAGVVVDSSGAVHVYAPVYPWNQRADANNLTPAWNATPAVRIGGSPLTGTQ